MKLANGIAVVDLHQVYHKIPEGFYLDYHDSVWTTRRHVDGTPVKILDGCHRFFHVNFGVPLNIILDDLAKLAKPFREEAFRDALSDPDSIRRL